MRIGSFLHLKRWTPQRIFVELLLNVFAIELGLMFLFAWLPLRLGGTAEALLDALLLTLLVAIHASLRIVSPLQRAARAERGHAELVLESIDDAVLSCDTEGRITRSNRAARELLGMPQEELQNLTLAQILSVDPDVQQQAPWTRADRPAAGSVELLLTQGPQSGRAIELRWSPSLRAKGSYVAVLRDLSVQRQTLQALREAYDRAQRLAELKSQFLANMSHEIRTPLNGVIGAGELLARTSLDSEQRELLDIVTTSSEGLLSVVNEVLDFSKLEAGRVEISDQPFSVQQLLHDIIKSQSLAARAQQTQLRLHIDPEFPERVKGDPDRTRQVLTNLIGNAIKFTQGGEVVVRAGWQPHGKDSGDVWADNSTDGERPGRERLPGFLRVVVEDTGIGIASDQLNTIFAAFAQGDGSTTRKYGGTGLGLAIARRLARLQGGDLCCTSTLGEGSSFVYSSKIQALGAADAQDNSTESHPADSVQTPPNDSLPSLNARILVADDNRINRIIAARILQKIGCDVVEVEDGEQALRAIAGQAFDAVLMDVQMPSLGGLEATQRLREREAGSGEHLPVIALTADAMPEDAQKCLAAGMDAYLAKPLSPNDLIATLSSLLHEQRGRGDSLVKPLNPAPLATGSETCEVIDAQTDLASPKEHPPESCFGAIELTGCASGCQLGERGWHHIGEIGKRQDGLREALQRGDLNAAASCADNMAESLRQIGAHDTVDLARELGQRARRADAFSVSALAAELDPKILDLQRVFLRRCARPISKLAS